MEPGYSRFKGNLLYDLQAAIVAQANRKYENQIITKPELLVGIVYRLIKYLAITYVQF